MLTIIIEKNLRLESLVLTHDMLPVLAVERRLERLCLILVGGLSFDTK